MLFYNINLIKKWRVGQMKALIMAIFFIMISAKYAFAGVPEKLIWDITIIPLCIIVALAVVFYFFSRKRKKDFGMIRTTVMPQQTFTADKKNTTTAKEFIDFEFEDDNFRNKKYRLYFHHFIKRTGNNNKDGKVKFITCFKKPKKSMNLGTEGGNIEIYFMTGTEKKLRNEITRIIHLVCNPPKPRFERLRLFRMAEITGFIKSGQIKPLISSFSGTSNSLKDIRLVA